MPFKDSVLNEESNAGKEILIKMLKGKQGNRLT